MENTYVAGNPSLNGRDELVVITGCSGGGKSTLLAELAKRGYSTAPEPGRQIVKEQILLGGDALPWGNVVKFAEACVARAVHFHANATGLTFFDRSCLDNVAAIEREKHGLTPLMEGALEHIHYGKRAFLIPPWEALFEADMERRHGFEEALEEYEYLSEFYPRHGYELIEVPKAEVASRADFIEREIAYLIRR